MGSAVEDILRRRDAPGKAVGGGATSSFGSGWVWDGRMEARLGKERDSRGKDHSGSASGLRSSCGHDVCDEMVVLSQLRHQDFPKKSTHTSFFDFYIQETRKGLHLLSFPIPMSSLIL
jgi:hypothetical protein